MVDQGQDASAWHELASLAELPEGELNDNLGVLYDQRGAAAVNGTIDYSRISGPTGQPIPKPDIGAYEVQQDDVVFDADFEDCVPPPL